jgi:hypothetical protein
VVGRGPFGWPELNAWVRVDPSDDGRKDRYLQHSRACSCGRARRSARPASRRRPRVQIVLTDLARPGEIESRPRSRRSPPRDVARVAQELGASRALESARVPRGRGRAEFVAPRVVPWSFHESTPCAPTDGAGYDRSYIFYSVRYSAHILVTTRVLRVSRLLGWP